jgi:hypothetical protein
MGERDASRESREKHMAVGVVRSAGAGAVPRSGQRGAPASACVG